MSPQINRKCRNFNTFRRARFLASPPDSKEALYGPLCCLKNDVGSEPTSIPGGFGSGCKISRHPENGSQGSKTAIAAPKASLTAGYSHHLHHLECLRYFAPIVLYSYRK